MPTQQDIFGNRSKASYSDPCRHGYPDPYANEPFRPGILYHVCKSCKASAKDGTPIPHKDNCAR